MATLVSGDLPSHTHTSAQISDATAAATAGAIVLRDGSGGANFAYAAANNLWAYFDSHLQSVECGAYGSVGGAFENMAKYSEDFTVGTWDKNGGPAPPQGTAPPRGMATRPPTPSRRCRPRRSSSSRSRAWWTAGSTRYVAKVASGAKLVSLAIVNNAYGAYLAGPTQSALTTAWPRFRITGTLAGGQTGLWIVVRQ